MPARDELPGTLRRSPKKAQETWIKTHDSAAESYGDGERKQDDDDAEKDVATPPIADYPP